MSAKVTIQSQGGSREKDESGWELGADYAMVCGLDEDALKAWIESTDEQAREQA